MKKIDNEELNEIYGGGAVGWITLGIIGIVTLISGIIDGLTRPLSCND